MLRIVIPVDGSEVALRPVNYLINKAALFRDPLKIHLLNVQHSFPGAIRGVPLTAQKEHHVEGLRLLRLGARAVRGDAEELRGLVTAELVTEHAERPGSIAKSAGDILRGVAVDEVRAQRLVHALARGGRLREEAPAVC